MCATPNGVALPVGPTIPVPTAYFPFTNDSVHSWPIPQYWAYNTSTVKATRTQWVEDSYFGTVIQCNNSLGAGARSCHRSPCPVIPLCAGVSACVVLCTETSPR